MRIRGLELSPGREVVRVTAVGDDGDDFGEADDGAGINVGRFPNSP